MARKAKKLIFADIPAWAVGDDYSRYSIAAALTLAGVWEDCIRLSADTQRRVFGAPIFGKCRIVANNQGITVSKSVCFGTDFSSVRLNWDRVESLIAAGLPFQF